MPVISAAALGALAGWAAAGKRSGKPRLRKSAAARSTLRRAGLMAARRTRGRRNLSKKAWQAKARRQVGVPRNYATSKTEKTVFPGDGTLVLRNAMSATPLLNGINKGTGINQRMRDTIVISGVKMDVAFQNLDKNRLMVNWAVVHPKQTQTITNAQKGFFRDYTDSRSWDANSATKTGLSWSMANINTDDYVILKRGKFLLTPGTVDATTPGTWNSKDSEKEMSHYLKLGRSFTYDTTSATPVIDDPLYFVTWCSWPSSPAGNNMGEGMRYKLKAVVYFRDPKTG